METNNRIVFNCSKCDNNIGIEVIQNGRPMLYILGVGPVYSIHGCCQCGQQLHWDSRDVIFRRVIKNKKANIENDQNKDMIE